MRILGNILWVVFGGAILAVGWFIAGLVLCITLIGIPFGIQCFKIAALVLWPFGKEISYPTVGVGSLLFNILWILIFGWELAVSALIVGVAFCITIIGIPFGLQAFKFAQLALFPFGARVTQTRIF
ncbi:MAG: YccF domain-containing protein [Erysipelotrichaceae bacterium]